MKKRMVAMIMTLTMVAGVLAGCGNEAADDVENGSVGAGSEKTADTGDEAEATTEPVEITWLGYYTSNITISEDTYAEKLLEEACNVKITPVTDVAQENMDTYVSSGDILNATCFTTYLTSNIDTVYEQELIREIPEEWLWEYYPTGMQYMKDFLGEEFFESGRHLYDGKVLYVPYSTCADTSRVMTVYRKDWLENLGMSEPTTLDEFHDMLYAFTYDDPDGNGKDDTYGTSCIYDNYGVMQVFGAFGISLPDVYLLQDDGRVIYNAVTEEYKAALRVMKEWYDEGIIDPESATDDRSATRTKWSNGTIGAMPDAVTWTDSNRGSSSIVAMVESVFGEGTVDVLGPLTTTYGDGTVYSTKKYPEVMSNRGLCFTAEASDEQVIVVLKMLETMSSDDELLTKIIYGEEGVDYTKNEEGVLIISDHVSVEYQASKGIGDTFYGVAVRSPHVVNMTFSDRDIERWEECELTPTKPYTSNFSAVTNEAYNQYQSEIKTAVKEYFYNVLLGNSDLEEDWDEYVSNLNKAGLEEIIAEYEELLK